MDSPKTAIALKNARAENARLWMRLDAAHRALSQIAYTRIWPANANESQVIHAIREYAQGVMKDIELIKIEPTKEAS